MHPQFTILGTVAGHETMKKKQGGEVLRRFLEVDAMGGRFSIVVPSEASFDQHPVGKDFAFSGRIVVGWMGATLEYVESRAPKKDDSPFPTFSMLGRVSKHRGRDYKDDNGNITGGSYYASVDAVGGRFSLYGESMDDVKERFPLHAEGEFTGALAMESGKLRLETSDFKQKGSASGAAA